VERYEWLPDVTLTVSSYEVKRASDAIRLESIYEAAAHGRWAHEANLVIEDPGVLNDRFLEEIARFRLGLFVMRRRGDGGFDVEQSVEPLAQNPNPADANELIDYFFDQAGPRLKGLYRQAIGR
jgi:hypothetical protein